MERTVIVDRISDFTKIRLHKDPTSQRSDFTKTLYTWYVPHCRVMVSHVLLSLCTPSRLLHVAVCSLTHIRVLVTHICSLLRFHSLSHFVHSLLLTFAFCSLTFAFCSLAFVRDSPVVRTELKRQYSDSKLRVEPANETMR